MNISFFWGVVQHRLVATYITDVSGQSIGLISRVMKSKTSVANNQSTPHNIRDEQHSDRRLFPGTWKNMKTLSQSHRPHCNCVPPWHKQNWSLCYSAVRTQNCLKVPLCWTSVCAQGHPTCIYSSLAYLQCKQLRLDI